MILERLLGDVSKSVFMDEHFLKLPFSLPGRAAEFRRLGSWETVERVLDQPDPDVLVVRQSGRWEGPTPPSYPQARELFESGYTLLVRHAERHHPEIAELAEAFQTDFNAPVDVHLYCTPAGEYGFGWHYDAEDVFILQTEGRKEYSLRKNTVNPWPVVETLPADMKFERELMPLMQCLLDGGDWLYIPNGYWHVGRAQDEDAISLAVGVMSPTALDVLDFLRERLAWSIRWRQRLPTTGTASHVSTEQRNEEYRRLFDELAEDLARTLQEDAFLRSYLNSRSGKGDPGDPPRSGRRGANP